MVENVSGKSVPPEISAIESAAQCEDRYIQNYIDFTSISLHEKRRCKGQENGVNIYSQDTYFYISPSWKLFQSKGIIIGFVKAYYYIQGSSS